MVGEQLEELHRKRAGRSRRIGKKSVGTACLLLVWEDDKSDR